ncbi:hypothetical protein BJY01DRAFT_247115 [Aspergillus pseudoustus]|uniref:Uncharacterized protein n=1 Tax=Aspergillus pseudoustus TaxID=1810923 RepID=A0ABR4K2Y0_9EURO
MRGCDGLPLNKHWKDGPRTLHGLCMRSLQSAVAPNFTHMLDEQARHIVFVVSGALRLGATTVEALEKGEAQWEQTILGLGKLRQDFLCECTPSYYNDEGKISDRTLKTGQHGLGSPASIQLLAEYKEEGSLAGLELDGQPAEPLPADELPSTATSTTDSIVPAVSPSTTTAVPVTKSDAWLLAKRITPRKSSGAPHGPEGVQLVMYGFIYRLPPTILLVLDVREYMIRNQFGSQLRQHSSTRPGEMQLTWMPCGAHSLPISRVSCKPPDFAAAYAETCLFGRWAAINAKFTIFPAQSNA